METDNEKKLTDSNIPLYRISCSNLPDELFDGTTAKLYFQQFGRVIRMYLRPKTKTCTIEYDSLESAERALNEAGFYNDIEFFVGSFGSKPKAKKKRAVKCEEELDPSWPVDPDVKKELEAMQTSEHKYVLRPEAMQIDLTVESKREKKVATKKNIKKALKNKILDNIANKKNEKIVTTVSKSVLDPALEAELLNTIKQAGHTVDEKYRILEARDKLIRLHTVKQVDIAKATKTIGTCPDMCPEKERLMREFQHQIAVYEQMRNDRGESCMNHKIAIKQYSRSSADQDAPLPHELRPVEILKLSMNYLLLNLADLCDTPDVNLAEWYHFIWDRTRGIRKDITQQELCCKGSVELIEQCARFHIHCSARLVAEDVSVFDQKINTENLTKCLQTLKYMYHDLELKNEKCTNEAEFRGYIILLNLNDGNFMWEVQHLRSEIQKSPEVQFAIKVFFALDNNNYVSFFKLVRSTTYLNSCILLRYFNQIRYKALKRIIRTHSPRTTVTQIAIEELKNILAFEDNESVLSFLDYHGLSFDLSRLHVILDRNSFTNPSLPYMLDRAVRVIESKRTCSVGEVIYGTKLPSVDFNQHIPHNSFDENGFLKSSEINESWKIKMSKTPIVLPDVKKSNQDVTDSLFKEKNVKPLLDKTRSSNSPLAIEDSQINKNLAKTSELSTQSIFSIPATNESKSSGTGIFSKGITQGADVKNIFSKQKNTVSCNIFNAPTPFVVTTAHLVSNIFSGNENKQSFMKSTITPNDVFQPIVSKPNTLFVNSDMQKSNDIFPMKPISTGIDSMNSNIFSRPKIDNLTSQNIIFKSPQIDTDQPKDNLFIINTLKEPNSMHVRSTQPFAKSIFQIKTDFMKPGESFKQNEEMVNKWKYEQKKKEELEKQKQEIIKMEEERKKQEEWENEKRREEERIKEKERMKEAERRKEEERKKEDERREAEMRAKLIEQMKQRQLKAKQEQQEENERRNCIKILLKELVIKADQLERERRLQLIKENIEKINLRNVLLKWRRKVLLMKRKRKAVDDLPIWVAKRTVTEEAAELYLSSQQLVLSDMKQYKNGIPIQLFLPQTLRINPIDLENVLYRKLKQRLQNIIEIKKTNLFWNLKISLPDYSEALGATDSINETVKHAFGLDTKEEFSNILVLKKFMPQGLDTFSVCIEKYTGLFSGLLEEKFDTLFVGVNNKKSIYLLYQRLLSLLKRTPKLDLRPVAFILRKIDDSLIESSIIDILQLDYFVEKGLISSYLILYDNIGTNHNLVNQIECGLQWLASNSSTEPPLEMDYFKAVLCNCLGLELNNRLKSCSKTNSKLKLALCVPDIVINIQNEALSKVCDILSDNFSDYPIFPKVFKKYLDNDFVCPSGYEYFPKYSLNQAYIRDILSELETLIIPEFGEWPPNGIFQLHTSLHTYCINTVANQRVEHVFLQIWAVALHHIENYKGKSFIEIMECFPWLDIIQIIISEKLNNIDYNNKSWLDWESSEHVCDTKLEYKVVVYDHNEMKHYRTDVWWYHTNFLSQYFNSVTECGIADCPSVDSYNTSQELDFDLDEALAEVTSSDFNEPKETSKENENINDFKFLLNDLQESIKLQKEAQQKFNKILNSEIGIPKK